MKEIIYLAEQFLEIAKLGFCDQDLRKVGVEHRDFLGSDLESIVMGDASRTFDMNGNKLSLSDTLLFSEKARNEFIEEYTLKLNEVRSVVKINRKERINKQIQELEAQRNLEAA